MNTFWLYRWKDGSGISGTGIVAEGVIFEGGQVAMRWNKSGSMGIYSSIDQVKEIHGHGGDTEVVELSQRGRLADVRLRVDPGAGDQRRPGARLMGPIESDLSSDLAAERAIADFWEAEAARGRANKIAGETDRHAWEAWGGETGEATGAYVVELGRPRSVPRIVWWHANRRTR